jgi:HK97 family phage major capsid protein
MTKTRLSDLKSERAKALDSAKRLQADAENENRDLNEDESSVFDELTAKAEKLGRDIKRSELLLDLEKRSLNGDARDPATADDEFAKESRRYSVRNAIIASLPPELRQRANLPRVDVGRELELSAECHKRSAAAKEPGSVMVPWEALMQRRPHEQRVIGSGSPANASNLISTDLLSGEFIDVLRGALIIRQAGARFLTGLRGDVAIPVKATTSAGSFVAEDADFATSEMTFGEITMTPKFVGAISSVTWKVLLQASPDVESLLRDDLTQAIAQAIDSHVISNADADAPEGLFDNAAILATGATGAVDWDGVLEFREQIELANASPTAWIANPRIRRQLRNTEKFAGTSGEPIMTAPNQLDGLPFLASTLVPDDFGVGSDEVGLMLGNFADLLVGSWSDVELLTNPYRETDFTKGRISIRATAAIDTEVRYATSFRKRINIPR